MSEDELEWCQYCKTMWYEVRSEGAPCGINGCNIYTCCDKAFQDHVRKFHPDEYEKIFPEE